MTELRVDHLESPVGAISLFVHGEALCALDLLDEEDMRARLAARYDAPRFVECDDPAGHRSRLQEYFAGRHGALDEIAVEPGGTAFQRRVWQALRDIRCGETKSYGEIARAIGSPGASRAVGMANHRNPIAIVVPCHRVVNGDRSLGGYAGGAPRKRWLLAHERALLLG